MSLRSRFYIALATSVFVIGIHMIAHNLYLYWTYRQIDIVIHMLGGFMSGLYVLFVLRYFKLKESLKHVLLGVFVVGVTWEVLEIVYKAVDYGTYYYFDTAKDIVDDLIGGALSLYVWRKMPDSNK